MTMTPTRGVGRHCSGSGSGSGGVRSFRRNDFILFFLLLALSSCVVSSSSSSSSSVVKAGTTTKKKKTVVNDSSLMEQRIISAKDNIEDEQESLMLQLYKKDEFVREYTLNNQFQFETSTNIQIVEFYNPNCPVCIEFASEYKQLAKETTMKWSTMLATSAATSKSSSDKKLEFWAMSCIDHVTACQRYGVSDVPFLSLILRNPSRSSFQILPLEYTTTTTTMDGHLSSHWTPKTLLAEIQKLSSSFTSTSISTASANTNAFLRHRILNEDYNNENDNDDQDEDENEEEQQQERDDDDGGLPKGPEEEMDQDEEDYEKNNKEEKDDDDGNVDEENNPENKGDDDDDDKTNTKRQPKGVGGGGKAPFLKDDISTADSNLNNNNNNNNNKMRGDKTTNQQGGPPKKKEDKDDYEQDNGNDEDDDNNEGMFMGSRDYRSKKGDDDDDDNNNNEKDVMDNEDKEDDDRYGDGNLIPQLGYNSKDNKEDDDEMETKYTEEGGNRLIQPPLSKMQMATNRDPKLGGISVQQKQKPPTPPQQQQLGRRPGAGADKARYQPKEMDRYQEEMIQQRQEYEQKRKRRKGGVLGKLVTKKTNDPSTTTSAEPKLRTNPQAMTRTMKAHTPGTPEYETRKEKMLKRIEKANKKKTKNKDKNKTYRNPAEPLGDLNQNTPIKLDTLPYKKDVRKQTLLRRFMKMTPEEELILDVTLSFVVGLESGVFLETPNGPLSAPKQTALHDFLDLLTVSMPPEWGLHRILDDLKRQFMYIVQSNANLKRVLELHPLPRRRWSKHCATKTPGFSCGFWKLLHMVTVGVAEHRGGLNLIESSMVNPATTKIFSPMDAADTIRNYIANFFTCGPCKKNFIETYDNCEKNRRCDRLSHEDEEASTADWKELSIWLWEVHNEVSVRILQERFEKQQKKDSLALVGSTTTARKMSMKDEVKVIWPNIETCFMCFKDDGTWDEAEVFKYLEQTYWPDSDLDPNSERLITYEGSDEFGVVFLWIFVVCLVALFYLFIAKTSPTTIQHGVLRARHLVAMANRTPGKKKMRSN